MSKIEEKKITKVGLSTFLLIIALIVIGVMSFFMCKFLKEKKEATDSAILASEELKKSKDRITELEEKINKVSDVINTKDSLASQNKNTVTNSLNAGVTTNNNVKNNMADKNLDNVEQAVKTYLEWISAKASSPSLLLQKLKLIQDESSTMAKKQGYLKTNVKYADFKNIILDVITEKCYNDDINKDFTDDLFIEEDGYLCYFNGGASGGVYALENLEINSENLYVANVVFEHDGGEEKCIFSIKTVNENGKVKIDNANQLAGEDIN